MVSDIIRHRVVTDNKLWMFKCGGGLIYGNGNNWLGLGKIVSSFVVVSVFNVEGLTEGCVKDGC